MCIDLSKIQLWYVKRCNFRHERSPTTGRDQQDPTSNMCRGGKILESFGYCDAYYAQLYIFYAKYASCGVLFFLLFIFFINNVSVEYRIKKRRTSCCLWQTPAYRTSRAQETLAEPYLCTWAPWSSSRRQSIRPSPRCHPSSGRGSCSETLC